jgi:hypothetical protein
MALSAFATRARATSKLNLSRQANKVSPLVARAEPAESSSAAAPATTATVYFGGKEYTEEQVSDRKRTGLGAKGRAKR